MIHVGTLRWVKYKISGLYDWTWCWEQNVCMGSAFFTCCCLMCFYLISVASNRQKQQQRIQCRSLELQLLGVINASWRLFLCLKMPSCLRLVPTWMIPLPTSKNTNHGKSTLAETCQTNLQMPGLTKKVGPSHHQLSGAMQPFQGGKDLYKPSPRSMNQSSLPTHPVVQNNGENENRPHRTYSITRRSTPAVDASMTWDLPRFLSNSKVG